MKVTLGIFTDGEKTWTSLLIDSIGVAQTAVQDIIGDKLAKIQLNDHAIYGRDPQFVDLDTGKTVFKNMCQNLYKNETLIMNINGGYSKLGNTDWELLEKKVFECSSRANLLTLLKEQNNKQDEFKLVSDEQ